MKSATLPRTQPAFSANAHEILSFLIQVVAEGVDQMAHGYGLGVAFQE